MAIQWSREILSKFLAPGIADFTSAQIPDLSERYPQAPHWVGNHFLNSVLRARFKDRWRQIVLAYIRRAQNAFIYYHEARFLTHEYLEGNQPDNPRIGGYFKAVSAWENFALQVSMAIDLLKSLQGFDVFKRNDGSKEERLYKMANIVKHTSKAVNSGQCPASGTIPLWLSNDGLCSFGFVVSFQEASEVLDGICNLANDLQDPHLCREKWSQESQQN